MISSSARIYARNEWGSGTVGGFFKFSGDDTVYGMTNKHVIADSADLAPGDVTVYLKATRQVAGTLQTWTKLNADGMNYLDVALFALPSGTAFSWLMPDGTAGPSDFGVVNAGDTVYMVLDGGSSQAGTVSMNPVNYVVPANFEGGMDFQFTGMIEIQSTDGSAFSDVGDSGSLIYNAANGIVGVLMGTDITGMKSYAVPFQNGRHGIDQVYQLTVATNDLNVQS